MTALGLYKILFIFELLVSFFIYGFRLKKKPRFILRTALCFAILVLAAAFFPVPVYNALYSSIMFLVLFLLSLVLLYFCYDEAPINIIFVGIAAYTTRHMAFQIFSIAETGFNALAKAVMDGEAVGSPFFLYGNNVIGKDAFSLETLFFAFIYLAVYIVSYYFAYCILGKELRKYDDLKISDKSLLALSGFLLIAEIFLHALLVYIADGYNALYSVLTYCYNILSCLFIFFMQKSLVNEKHLKNELTFVNRLLTEEREQYEASRKNIELINMKCHDIRHQIREGYGGNVDKEYLSGIEKLITIYDSTVKTGNAELDLILTEKSLLCAQNSITFTCMADGKKLAFMDKTDIYALFGNLVDNAVEAVMKIEKTEERIIELSVKASEKIIAISVKNRFDGEILTGKDGLPVTTKKRDGYHGYGLKSIKFIAEKYGGDFNISLKNGVFGANIVIFLPSTSKTGV